jgi:hypothetical protein
MVNYIWYEESNNFPKPRNVTHFTQARERNGLYYATSRGQLYHGNRQVPVEGAIWRLELDHQLRWYEIEQNRLMPRSRHLVVAESDEDSD